MPSAASHPSPAADPAPGRAGSGPAPRRSRPGRPRAGPALAVRGLAVAGLLAGLLAGCSGPSSPGRPPAGASAGQRGAGSGGFRPAPGVVRGAAPAGWAGGGEVFVSVGGAGGGVIVGRGLGASGSRPEITVGPVPPARSDQAVNLPLNTYADVAEAQQSTLSEATTLLTQQCMSARGFVYSTQATPSQVQALYQAAEYSFGVTSPADASTFGYGRPRSGAAGQGPAFLGGFATFGDLAKQPRAWVAALLGFAPGARISRSRQPGCLPLASQELYGRGGGLSDPVPQIALQASQWTQSDPRVLAVSRAWSRCMALAGYHYATPQQAAGRNWPRKPTAAETSTATADVRCKHQVNLANTWLSVEAAYQSALISENLATLTALQGTFGKLIARAEFLLTAGSASAR